MTEKIDFIIAWVDDWDKEWQKERNRYAWKNPEDVASFRFRDWWTLKYLFRWIEKFAPRVNNVFFVTCWQLPSWLNLDHPKLKFIKHEDYIPKEYLPTFNANTIELNFHRIKELSEHFVYFNDDMFITNYMKETDFFENWLPKHIAWLSAIPSGNETNDHMILNDTHLINRHFSFKDLMKNNKRKRFFYWYSFKILVQTLFLQNYSNLVWMYNSHMPNPLLKSTIKKVWDIEYNVLDYASITKFREKTDVNQYIFSWWDIASWNFMPKKSSTWCHFSIGTDNNELIKSIINKRYKMICMHDSENLDFEKAKKEIIDAFEKILPEKSNFEI